MCENNDVTKPGTDTISKKPKQKFILLTILALTLVTTTSNALYPPGNYRYFCAPGALVMLIATWWRGRRLLCLNLFILSLLSSINYGTEYQAYSVILHAPVQGSAAVLLYIVICEYCNPKDRFFYLIANSAIQMLFYWVTVVLQYTLFEYFGYCLQYFNIIIAVLGLWAVYKWPESPYWLASKGRFEESAKAFVEVRGGSELSEELAGLTKAPRLGSSKMIYVPILIAFPFLCMSIRTYDTVTFFEDRAKGVTSPEIRRAVGIYCLFMLSKCIAAVACVVTALLRVNLPRKLVFLLCAVLYLAEYFFDGTILDENYPALVLFLDTMLDYGPKIVTLPLLVEVIPQKYVTMLTACFTIMYFVLEYLLLVPDLPPLSSSFIFATGVIISYFLMPNSKEKSLIEIEEMYLPKKEELPQPNQTDL